jgi:thiopeptide-type bacteriocin biosynthesis protein
MLVSERVFHVDSEAALALADLVVRGRLHAADRWRVALVSAHMLLTSFGLNAGQRKALVDDVRERYMREQGITTAQARPISERFRAERAELSAMLDAAAYPASAAAAALHAGVGRAIEVLRERTAQLQPAVSELHALSESGRLTTPTTSIVSSYVHMSMVRQLRSAVRRQETVIYDFLSRLYGDPRRGR